jgi:flavin reductase (DIM6/NTAB) family NADH-FMN oxidoreductase RutF
MSNLAVRPPETPMISPTAMREAMGRFAAGVTIITALDTTGTPAGCTVSAFSSVSLDPPLVLVCIDTSRFMHGLLTEGPGFAVNILSSLQAGLALSFARQSADKFAGVAHHPGYFGVPLVDGAIAHVQCTRHAVYDGGDHAIVVGRVFDIRVAAGEPLLYSSGRFLDIEPRVWDEALAVAPHEWLQSAPW